MGMAYQVIPFHAPKAIPFHNKTILDILTYVDAEDVADLEIIPISPGILIWANSESTESKENLAFKINLDDSLVFGKAIFTGVIDEEGMVNGLTGVQFTSIPSLIQLPNYY